MNVADCLVVFGAISLNYPIYISAVPLGLVVQKFEDADHDLDRDKSAACKYVNTAFPLKSY